jgi:hypothetical protein
MPSISKTTTTTTWRFFVAQANFFAKELFIFYSRPLFRTCEIVCNHSARLRFSKARIKHDWVRAELRDLNEKRISFQRELNRISKSHPEVCADCKGHCCGGTRERDAFIDRVMQDPDTPFTAARRKAGSPLLSNVKVCEEDRVAVCDNHVEGHCLELTTTGCRIPYELRPIQCTVYFCRRYVNALSRDEIKTGLKAMRGLMVVQLQTVMLMLKA